MYKCCPTRFQTHCARSFQRPHFRAECATRICKISLFQQKVTVISLIFFNFAALLSVSSRFYPPFFRLFPPSIPAAAQRRRLRAHRHRAAQPAISPSILLVFTLISHPYHPFSIFSPHVFPTFSFRTPLRGGLAPRHGAAH